MANRNDIGRQIRRREARRWNTDLRAHLTRLNVAEARARRTVQPNFFQRVIKALRHIGGRLVPTRRRQTPDTQASPATRVR